MRLPLAISSLIFISTFAQAGIETDYPEVADTILTLGLELNDFSTLWPSYCNPKWSTTTSYKSYKEVKFTRDAVNEQFFLSEKNGNDIKLSAGKKCKALNEYYFNDTESNIISAFVKKDKSIREKYGYSSIDLYKYSHNYQGNYTTNNPTPGYKERILKQIKRFKDQNIFNVKEKIKNTNYKRVGSEFVEVKVPPYSTFYVTPTKNFISAHKRLENKK